MMKFSEVLNLKYKEYPNGNIETEDFVMYTRDEVCVIKLMPNSSKPKIHMAKKIFNGVLI